MNQIRRLWRLGAVGAASDGELLDRFVADRGEAGEAAFEELVRRHGSLVLRVCRGVLHDEHDAEDAFQAVFLVLANRAGSIRDRGSVASWLFGVAHRVAMRGRRRAARRRALDRIAAARTSESYLAAADDPDREILHEEIAALPERLRAPVVLCGLQGLTYDAAAMRLGVSNVAVRGRLARAREKLKRRLIRRGVAIPAGFLAAGAISPAEAVVPASLIHSTLRITQGFLAGGEAAVLARGVLNAMLLNHLKAATIVLCLGAWGGQRLWTAVAADEPANRPRTTAPAPAPPAYRLTGSVRLEGTGEPVPGGRITVLLGEAIASQTKQSREVTSGVDGRFVADLPPGQAKIWRFQAPDGYWSADSMTPQETFVLTKSQPTHQRDFVVRRGNIWHFELLGPDRQPLKGGVSSLTQNGFVKAEADREGRIRLALPTLAGKTTVMAGPGASPPSRLSHLVLIPLEWEASFRADGVRKIERIKDAYRVTDDAGRSATIGESTRTVSVDSGEAPALGGEGHVEPTLVGDRLVIRAVFSEGRPTPRTTSGSVTGRVVDGAGRPIEGVHIGRGGESGGSGAGKSGYGVTPFRMTFLSNEADEAVTDRDGRFRVKILLTDPSDVSTVNFLVLRKKGLATLESARFSFQPGPLNAPLELEPIRMEPGASLSGIVVDPRGKPVEGAWVRPIDGLALFQSFTRTDADGRFVVDDLPRKPINLQVEFGSLAAKVEAVASKGDEGLKIQLRPKSEATTEGFRMAPPEVRNPSR